MIALYIPHVIMYIQFSAGMGEVYTMECALSVYVSLSSLGTSIYHVVKISCL